MPELKMEALDHFPRLFNSFRNEAKNRATESSLYTVVPNLTKDISVETFFQLVKTILVKMLLSVAFKGIISNTRDHVVSHYQTQRGESVYYRQRSIFAELLVVWKCD